MKSLVDLLQLNGIQVVLGLEIIGLISSILKREFSVLLITKEATKLSLEGKILDLYLDSMILECLMRVIKQRINVKDQFICVLPWEGISKCVNIVNSKYWIMKYMKFRVSNFESI